MYEANSSVNIQPGITTDPGNPPGSSDVNGVTIRCLRDTPEDAQFAAKLTVDGFKGKFAHNITERKLPIAVKHMTAQHQGQPESFYRRTFVAELHGTPVGLLQLKFKGDREIEKDDHISELGCWHAIRYSCFGSFLTDQVDQQRNCYLDHICVSDGARGKGVGKLLLDRADFEARLRGCNTIYLYVMTDNRAIQLYERHEYKITSTHTCCISCWTGPPGECYKMEKPL